MRQKRPICVKRDLSASKETYLRQKRPICQVKEPYFTANETLVRTQTRPANTGIPEHAAAHRKEHHYDSS